MPVDRVHEAVHVLGQLPRHPGLADAGHAGDRHEARPPVAGGGKDDVAQQPELVGATDEGGLDLVGPAAAPALGDDPEGKERGHWRDLALEQLITGRFEGDGRIRRLFGLLTDEDGAGSRHTLEPGRGVDDVSRDETLVRGTDRHGRLAGQDARACLETGPERSDAIDQVERSPDRAFGVVVVRDGSSPDRHHRVADELLDRAAVAADDLLAMFEVVRQKLSYGLGVAALGKRREPDQIGEQDGDETAFGDGHGCPRHGRGGRRRGTDCRLGCRGPARRAEPGAGDERGPATRAGRGHRRPAVRTEPRVGRGGLAARRADHPAQSTQSCRSTVVA